MIDRKEKILIIDDETQIGDVISGILESKYKPLIATTEEESYDMLRKHAVSLVLLDVCLTPGNQEGLNILKYCKANLPFLPVIMMSGHTNVDDAVEAVKEGAVDFIEKPFSRQKLLTCVEREIEEAERKRIYARLQQFDYDTNLVANSPSMVEVMSKLQKVINNNSRIMFVGEKGTGTTALAYYTHMMSSSKTSRYYELDCSTIADKTELINKLVGVNNANNGLLFAALDGTLVMDKIEQANVDVQSGLQHLLTQLTGNKVNFKIISIAKPSIFKMIEDGSFKKDLFLRLSTCMIEIPLLKERLEDFLPLIKKFSLPFTPEVQPQVLSILQGHSWEGNLHELKNVVQQMVLKNPQWIEVKNLTWKVCELEDPSMLLLNYRDALAVFTEKYFQAQLTRAEGNQTTAAENAGVDRSTLYRRRQKKVLD